MALPIRKVLFIEPRSPRAHIFSRVVIPRLGCVLLGTILKQQGLEVKVIIEEVNSPDLDRLDFQPDLVCISSISSTIPRAFQLADYYRQQGVPVVMGGPHSSFLPAESLEHADYVVSGEGDEALPELITALNEGSGFESIANLNFHRGEELQINPRRPFIEDLDILPIPDYSLIHGWRTGKQRYVSIATSRGCPFNCRFCSVIQMFGRRFRYNSVDRIVEEVSLNGVQSQHLFFCDDNFTVNRERIKNLLERMLSLGLKVEWSAQVRVEAARDMELLELMARSGCYIVFVGLESINPATLKAYNKSQTVEDIQDCVINFHRAGIKVHGMFVFGSEEDNPQVIKETVKFSRRLDLDSLQYLILTPLPGTPVYDELEAQNRIICRDWSRYDAHHTVFLPRQMTPYELQWETFKAMKRFYSWSSAVKRLIRRDYFMAMLKIHGRLHLKRAFYEKKGYFQQLKDQLFSRARQWRAYWPRHRRIRRVGIPEDIWQLTAWETGPREFLLRFLERLGVEIVREGKADLPALALDADNGQIATLIAEINNLQEKVDVILLPFWQGLEGFRQKAKDWHQELGDRLHSWRRTVAIEFDRGSFYNVCMQLGLCFKARPRRIRRIYFQTLGEVGVQV
ncbi:MAG: B12-binding domain-containing radical SAM protein [Deltaproteobacteria bacterium]|nr:B12-binding domain-containing radical SAM protein [Deltaproteobacteria bacterium]MBW1951805.1 B12-binding domain-containing radical SAM protein [Deltaproteobacteria bacterium]MBW1985629.1 B12-binding domain-containing radical SAM protein [Deltaproteobacteria bacterium]MBW2134431.1 B12-binding domain-containing radical SAM protein [Deltaproteobacteria bacterium]